MHRAKGNERSYKLHSWLALQIRTIFSSSSWSSSSFLPWGTSYSILFNIVDDIPCTRDATHCNFIMNKRTWVSERRKKRVWIFLCSLLFSRFSYSSYIYVHAFFHLPEWTLFYVVLCSAFAKHLKIFFHFFRRLLARLKCICSCRAQKIIRHFFLLCTFSFFGAKKTFFLWNAFSASVEKEWVKMHVQGRIIFILYLPPFHDLFFRLQFHGCAIFYQIFLASQSLLLIIFYFWEIKFYFIIFCTIFDDLKK